MVKIFTYCVRAQRALAILTLTTTAAFAGEVYVGQWNGLVPASMEILDESTLRFCQEDLKLQCRGPVPYHREGRAIVVEHRSDGLKWTYIPRADGGFDAAYFRWDGEGGYKLLATAILTSP